MKYFVLALLVALVGCGRDSVYLNDHKDQIDSNTARIMLVETQNALQDLKIKDLEVRVSDLENRMTTAEASIDQNESDILDLFDAVDNLEDDLADLRDDLRRAVRRLMMADLQTRRLIRSEVRSLRRSLSIEIRRRQLADMYLQYQIDNLENDLDSFEAQQSVINSFLASGLVLTNLRITQLQSQISYALANINSQLSNIQSQVNSINAEISNIQSQMSSMQAQLDDVESKLVSVVYPCGEGNSQEVLLQTQDGLVAYFQQMTTITETFEAQETIPSYTICTHPWKQPPLFNCPPGHVQTIPASTNSTPYSVEVTHDVLQKAYLDVLGDGNYRTTDGYSCNFSIVNGEVQ